MNHKYINSETFEICDNIFEVDEDIAETISILNKKGYYTKYCCSGHSMDPRLYEKYNIGNNEEFEYKELGYVVNNEKDSFDILLPYIFTAVYIMFDEDFDFEYLPVGFKKEENNIITKKIYFYKEKEKKSWDEIDNEIKITNDNLLKWAISLPKNKKIEGDCCVNTFR